MKTQAISSHVERSGVQTENTFTIKATSKAFDILSSGLYSNKILAIVRELCCNAHDAHVAAGKANVPIEVRLPTHLDPTFYVKDFGIGLDHNGVTQLYTTYFESTKQDSNDFIGALGLGSKSPFSYSSAFTVEARFNGSKRIYTAFKNESGMPSISLMNDESTDEVNGMTVSLSVKKDDCEKFHNEAKKALMYFNPSPVVVGRSDFLPHRLNHSVSGSNWKIRETEYWAYMNGPYVVQGFVAYPVDSEILEDYNMSEPAKLLARTNIDLFVPIGQVEVAASREALSYDKRTAVNLVMVLEAAAAEMRSSFQKEFDACSTSWEAAMLLDKFEHNTSGTFSNIFRKMNLEIPFKWNGADVTSSVLIDMSTVKATTITRAYNSESGKKINYSDKWEPSTHHAKFDLNVQANLYILIDRESKGNGDVIRQFLESQTKRINGHRPAAILIRPTSKTTYNQDEIDDIIVMFGNPPVQYVSQIPYTKTKSTKSSYTKKDKAVKMVWKGFQEKTVGRWGRTELNRVFSRLTWTSATIDMTSGGVYVPVERFMVCRKINGPQATNLDIIIDSATRLGLLDKDTDIIGLNEKEMKEIEGDDGWYNLFDLVQSNFEVANATNDLVNRAVISSVFRMLDRDFVTNVIQRWDIVSKVFDDGEFKTFCQTIVDDNKRASTASAETVASFTQAMGISFNADKLVNAYINKWRKVVAEYKLLRYMNWAAVGTDGVKEVATYINSVHQPVAV